MVDAIKNMENQLIEKAKFYQEMGLWPRTVKLNYYRWLENFTDEKDREIAKQILDYFVYYSSDLVDQLLIAVIGKCGYLIKDKNPSWTHHMFKTHVCYSFVPGEHPHPTDSGNLFTRKLRDVLHIPEGNIKDFKELSDLMRKVDNMIVILVDDFVGSGLQCSTAWNKPARNDVGYPAFCDIVKAGRHEVYYAPLITNHVGYKEITDKCNGLQLVTMHILGEEYSLGSPKCLCWKGDNHAFLKGIELIERKSKELGIPTTDEYDPRHWMGLRNQGLALAFEHGMPDACPSFFYWHIEGKWNPLIEKEYDR